MAEWAAMDGYVRDPRDRGTDYLHTVYWEATEAGPERGSTSFQYGTPPFSTLQEFKEPECSPRRHGVILKVIGTR